VSSDQRLHALDNLRAIMMWLGIVLHAGAIYIVAEYSPLPWRDEQRTPLADLLMGFIHAFRMPVFFILAGYFACMLGASRGPAGLLRHRFKRLALPFVLFWPLLWVACGLAGLAFLNRMAFGEWGLSEAAAPAWVPRGPNTMHLWFLWLLFLFCAVTSLAMRLPGGAFARPAALLERLAQHPAGFALLAVPLALAGMGYPSGVLAPSGFFLPPAAEWLHNGLFFAFGLMLYGRQETLFALFRRNCWRYALAGILFFIATGSLMKRQGSDIAIAYVYNCTTWLWSFAAIGLALRFLDLRHAALAYLADSAYWVYLLHFPFTILFGALLFEQPLPALVKMALNIAATTFVCLASYQLFVRHTWVSVLLNGKRHPRPIMPRWQRGTASR
jgi:glucan biosynthesis protein C